MIKKLDISHFYSSRKITGIIMRDVHIDRFTMHQKPYNVIINQ